MTDDARPSAPKAVGQAVGAATRRKAARAAKAAKAASKAKQRELAKSADSEQWGRGLEEALGLVSFTRQTRILEKMVRARIRTILSGDQPVIVGPFLGEVGFELLYWIPLLRWIVREFPELEERIVIVSRGGSWHWYGQLASRYVDVLSIWSAEEFHNVRGTVDKQREVWKVEDDLLRVLREREGLQDAIVLHPSLMYTLYYVARKIDNRAWPRAVSHEDRPASGLMAIYEPITPPSLDPLAGELPDDYVAVKFYSRPSFPDTPETRRFAADVIRSLARDSSVVLLDTGLELDDHSGLPLELGDSVVTIDELLGPADNLHVQTIALSRADAFVGTYGGFAYLAPFLGVPSLSFSAVPKHAHPWHLDLARQIFEGSDWGSFMTMRPDDLPLVNRLSGGESTSNIDPNTSAAGEAAGVATPDPLGVHRP